MATQTKRKLRTKSSGGRSIPPRKKKAIKDEGNVEWEMRMNVACNLTEKQKKAFVKFYDDTFGNERPPASVLIREARKKKNKAVWDLFDNWNVEVAAERHWEAQAKYLMRNLDWVKYDIVTQEIIGKPIKAFVNIDIKPDRSVPTEYYIDVRDVYKKEDVAFIMKKCRRELTIVVERYQHFAAFFDIYGDLMRELNKIKFPDEE